MGQHPIESVGLFANIFQNQNCPIQIRHVGTAQQVRSHCEIGRDQWPFGNPIHPSTALQIGNRTAEQQGAQALLAPVWFGRQGAQQRAMNSAIEAGALAG